MEPEYKYKEHRETCFKCGAPSIDSIVHLGNVAMDSKNLDIEMNKETPFGEKLRKIAEKVEAL